MWTGENVSVCYPICVFFGLAVVQILKKDTNRNRVVTKMSIEKNRKELYFGNTG